MLPRASRIAHPIRTVMEDQGVRRITWRLADIARVLALGLLFLFFWQFFWMVYTALFLALIAILLAIVIHAPAKLLARWMPFRLGFALTVLVFFGVLAGVFIAVIPQVVSQITQLTAVLPSALTSVTEWVEQRTGTGTDSMLAERVGAQLGDFVGRFVPFAFNLLSIVFGSFAILILAIFLAVQPEVYRGLVLRLAPPQSSERWERVYDEAGRSLRNWVIGKTITMLITAVVVWVGLTLFKIPGALALTALAAAMEFVPNLGPTIAAAPAVIAAFLVSPITALWVAVFYFVLQQIQNAITVPLVEQRAVNIPPAVLLIWQLMLTIGFGILGLFIATPLLAVIVVAGRILYFEPLQERQEWDRRERAATAEHPSPSGEGPSPDAPVTLDRTPENPYFSG